VSDISRRSLLKSAMVALACPMAAITRAVTPSDVICDYRNFKPGDPVCPYRFFDPKTGQPYLIFYYDRATHHWGRLACLQNGDRMPKGFVAIGTFGGEKSYTIFIPDPHAHSASYDGSGRVAAEVWGHGPLLIKERS
jgi:hypothetical protein